MNINNPIFSPEDQKELQAIYREIERKSELALNVKKTEASLIFHIEKLLGLKSLCKVHSKENTPMEDWNISIWVTNEYGATFDVSMLREYYEKLCTLFMPEQRGIEVSGKTIWNYAPAMLRIDNNVGEIVFDHPQTVQVQFQFMGNLTISFKAHAIGLYSQMTTQETGHYRIYNRERVKQQIKPDKTRHNQISWYGSQYSIYAGSEEDAESFMEDLLNPLNK